MRFFMGLDPDMHQLPIAIVDETGKLAHLQIVTVPKTLTGREALVAMNEALSSDFLGPRCEAVCVEGQDIYQFGASKTKNPKSIMFLATVAGMTMSRFLRHSTRAYCEVYFPTPQEWKGNVPKQIHQARVLSRMGIKYNKVGTVEDGYCVPNDEAWSNPTCLWSIKKGDWKHAVDAIGLAQFGREKFLETEAREKRNRATGDQA